MLNKFLLIAIMSAVVSTALFAQTYTCVASGDWNNTLTWSPQTVPGNGAAVLLIFDSNVTVNLNATTASVGALKVSNNATVTFNSTGGTNAVLVGNSANAVDLDIQSGSTLILQGASNISLSASSSGIHSINGTLEQNTPASLGLSKTTVNGTVRSLGAVTGSAMTLSWASGSTLELKGNGYGMSATSMGTWASDAKLIWSGITNFSPALAGASPIFGIIEVNCPSAVVDINLGSSATITAAKLSIIDDGSGSFSFGPSANTTIVGDLSLNSGTVYKVGASTSVKGDLANGGTLTTAGTSNLIMNGAAAQVLASTTMVGSVNLEISNALGVTLFQDVKLSHDLTLTLGNINSSTGNLLIMNDGKTVVGGSLSSHVNGPMKKEGDDLFTFPIGNGTRYAPAVIGAGGAVTDAFTATYIGTGLGNITLDPPLLTVSTLEYWDIERNTGATARTVGLTWGAHSFVGSPVDLRVGHFDGVKWTNMGGTNSGMIVTSNPVGTFSPFTLASVSLANPLPLELLNFKGLAVNKVVNLSWTTTHEVDITEFVIERSINGIEWEYAGRSTAKGNDINSVNSYRFDDRNPLPGLSYYRFKVWEQNGTYTYSNAISVNNKTQVIRLFPNPSSDYVVLSRTSSEEVEVQIFNQNGALVRNFNSVDRQDRINIADLPAGKYTLSILDGNLIQSIQLVKN